MDTPNSTPNFTFPLPPPRTTGPHATNATPTDTTTPNAPLPRPGSSPRANHRRGTGTPGVGNLGNVVFNMNGDLTLYGVVVPRVGNVLCLDSARDEGEAFTGGSNIAPSPLMPLFVNQRRPLKYSSIEFFSTSLKEGVEFKLTSPNEKSNTTTLPEWFKSVANKLENFGLDTVFRVPLNAWTEEVYIAKDWGKAKLPLVKPWVLSLEGGVTDDRTHKTHLPCQYDKMNLYYSGQFLLYCVTTTYRRELIRELGERPHGPILMCHLLKNRLILVLSRQRKLIAELTTLSIGSEPAENVRNFNIKVQTKCEEIEQTGSCPPDLALLTSKLFLNSQVEQFVNTMFSLTRELEKEADIMTWYDVLQTAKDEYDLLEEWWTPAGKAGSGTVSKKEFQNYINKTNPIINNLKIESSNGNGSTLSTSTSSTSSSN